MSPTKLVRRALIVTLALGAVAVAGAPEARASDVRSGAPPAWYVVNPGVKPMTLMHRMDEDRSGGISKEEFLKFHEQLFDEIDTNHDGQISTEEWMGRSSSLASHAKGAE